VDTNLLMHVNLTMAAVWEALRADEKIVAERLPHLEGNRSVTRDLWAPAGTPRPEEATRLNGRGLVGLDGGLR
jgi:hypothetical protein